MPRGDKTGPAGNGPMTGRRLGNCVGNDWPGHGNVQGTFGNNYGRGLGRGNRRGGGMGYGYRQGYGRFLDEGVQNVSNETLLENEARILKEQLASIEKQLSELKKGTD